MLMATIDRKTESGPLARAVAAEIRAAMGRQRKSGLQLAAATGLSQNYLAKRLRDEAPFTINDIEKICTVLDEDFATLMASAATHRTSLF
jgi:transcriptional regulator with XRE-family HTH domain